MKIKEKLKRKTTIYVFRTLTSHLAKIITVRVVVISQQRKKREKTSLQRSVRTREL